MDFIAHLRSRNCMNFQVSIHQHKLLLLCQLRKLRSGHVSMENASLLIEWGFELREYSLKKIIRLISREFGFPLAGLCGPDGEFQCQHTPSELMNMKFICARACIQKHSIVYNYGQHSFILLVLYFSYSYYYLLATIIIIIIVCCCWSLTCMCRNMNGTM